MLAGYWPQSGKNRLEVLFGPPSHAGCVRQVLQNGAAMMLVVPPLCAPIQALQVPQSESRKRPIVNMSEKTLFGGKRNGGFRERAVERNRPVGHSVDKTELSILFTACVLALACEVL